jgi:hypothetical protein
MFNKTKDIALIVLLISAAFLGFNYIQGRTSKTEKVSNIEKPLSTLTIVKLTANCNLYVVINPDSVWFDPFENVCANNSFSIEKSQYPELFKQGVSNSSFISVEKTSDPDLTLIVSNNQPDHGGYLPVYQLTVNLKTHEVKEYKSEELQ